MPSTSFDDFWEILADPACNLLNHAEVPSGFAGFGACFAAGVAEAAVGEIGVDSLLLGGQCDGCAECVLW